MAKTTILLILPNLETGMLLERAAVSLAGTRYITVTDWSAAFGVLEQSSIQMVVVSDSLPKPPGVDPAFDILAKYATIPVVRLLGADATDGQMLEALRQGFFDCMALPLSLDQLQALTQRAEERRRRLDQLIKSPPTPDVSQLEKRLKGLEAIEQIGRKVTSLLDLDNVLAAVVDAAVELTEAEEGSLLLLDETSGELYMRASKNFKQDFVNTFRLPIRNSLVAQVLKTGLPVVIDEETPHKIKTAYLVHTLIYVPLMVQDRVIGVLEVDHRQTRKSFSADHVAMVSTLADYAAIAIENARLYAHSERERQKLETMLSELEEGVLIVDSDRRVLLMNRKACQAFEVTDPMVYGRRLKDVISLPEMLETLRDADPNAPSRVEITLRDGRVLNTQLTPLPEIGLVVTMQDITHLKELDRIKSDFVNTVSHDLRSPLTAILGYIELFDRVGPVNDQQREFIHRVQISVHNITALINDLLDLGRIEAGFDVRKETVPFSAIVHYVVDGVRPRCDEKEQILTVDVPEDLPTVLGNPIRLRQMMGNLVTNAVKYTPHGGHISIYVRAQGGQLILQISDNGPGIPPADQPYIFDKFYRASNAPLDTPGTGLGLAIVKSIVENHLGRIWVESSLAQGAAFTVILPTSERTL